MMPKLNPDKTHDEQFPSLPPLLSVGSAFKVALNGEVRKILHEAFFSFLGGRTANAVVA